MHHVRSDQLGLEASKVRYNFLYEEVIMPCKACASIGDEVIFV
jgi:hypothetical protein